MFPFIVLKMVNSPQSSESLLSLLSVLSPSPFRAQSSCLPAELSEQIFLRLDLQSLCRASQVCRRWHGLIHESEAVWRGQCARLRPHCSRELERDRGQGLSWKVILMKNYPHICLKHDWLRGRFSGVQSANELQDVEMVPFDAETWGEILQAELDR
uniref:F-box domain-containing protein n=1 Tax=Periophthalmus magnuspinnatus TaxID=409849 RepID=A0A3B4AFG2_9GOBI